MGGLRDTPQRGFGERCCRLIYCWSVLAILWSAAAAALQPPKKPGLCKGHCLKQQSDSIPTFYRRCNIDNYDTVARAEPPTWNPRRKLLQAPLLGSVTVPTYVWIIYKGPKSGGGNSYANGYVPLSQVTANLRVLNSVYNTVGLNFVAKNISYIDQGTWFSMQQGTASETAAKMALRGNTNTASARAAPNCLHIYSALPVNTLGFTYYPAKPPDYRDGSVIFWQTWTGGQYSYSNKGYTLVHEVGHWLSLKHTFNGDPNGCVVGDVVNGTAWEATANGGCPVGRKTCPLMPNRWPNPKTDPYYGLDPIWNFMDYLSDACMTGLEPTQFQRIANYWVAYRDPSAYVKTG